MLEEEGTVVAPFPFFFFSYDDSSFINQYVLFPFREHVIYAETGNLLMKTIARSLDTFCVRPRFGCLLSAFPLLIEIILK